VNSHLPIVPSAAVLALGRPTFDLELGAAQVLRALPVLDEAIGHVDGLADLRAAVADGGGIVVDDHDPEIGRIVDLGRRGGVALVIVLQATFADARTAIAVAEGAGLPVVVWSFPEERTGGRLRLNSLCGANLAAYSLRRRHHPAAFVHVDPAAPDAAARLAAGIAAVRSQPARATAVHESSAPHDVDTARRLIAELRQATVGVVGDPPDGFEPCTGDDDTIRATLGVDVEHCPLGQLFAAAGTIAAPVVEATTRRIGRTLDVQPGVAEQGLEQSVRLYGGLRSMGAAQGWSAVSTRCWPECMTDYGGAVCTPQAMLTEDGMPGVCEADLLGSITALMLQRLAGSDPFVADLVDVDVDDDTSVLWHCGVASSSLAVGHREGVLHPNRHRALVSQFALKPGRVTVARISQAGGPDAGLCMVVGEGEMLDEPRAFSGTSGVIRWDRPASAVVRTVFDAGLEHHLAVVYGDHRDVLVAIAEQWGLPVVELGVT